MMRWEILETGNASAETNMAIDHQLLEELPKTKVPILRLYGWEGSCATYGHFLNPFQLLKKDIVERSNLQLAKRPTGGGLLFHLTDYTFSILVPSGYPAFSTNTLENYAFVNGIVVKVIQELLGREERPHLLAEETGSLKRDFCMAKPTIYDVMWEGRKVGGAAQRRTKHGFLHQGTISLAMPEQTFLRQILIDDVITEEMQKHTCCLGEYVLEGNNLSFLRRKLSDLLIKKILRL